MFLLALMWASLTLYAVLAGADFGAGIWDLLAGSATVGRRRRALMEHVIGPVWEANHVWLIFVLVLLWTCYPPAFAAIASTLYVPLTLVALGIIGRGAAFAFRKAVTTDAQRRLFGATFAASSVVTPFFLGAAAGAIASDRVPPGIARGGVLTSWVTPISLVTGALSVSACAFLAGVYLLREAAKATEHADGEDLVGYFRARALISGAVTGALSIVGIFVAWADAPGLAHALSHRGLPLVLVSAAAGCASLALVALRHFVWARGTAALAVAAVLWAWGVGRYPQLLPGLSVGQAEALPATIHATTWAVVVGIALLVPSMLYLFVMFQRTDDQA